MSIKSPSRVILVAENATFYSRGEAARPLHYFEGLHRRGVDVHLVVHERNRAAIHRSFADVMDRFHFVNDSNIQKTLASRSRFLPARWRLVTVTSVIHLITQARQKSIVKKLIAECDQPCLVHQPIPITPYMPSVLFGLGVPVVIGPLNGKMDYPIPFREREPLLTMPLMQLARIVAIPLNRLLPGRCNASVILVANERTRKALPYRVRGQVVQLTPNAVDPRVWSPHPRPKKDGPICFAFLGELVKFKGVDVLLRAFRCVTDEIPAKLEVIGSGPERTRLEKLTEELGLKNWVTFHGRLHDEPLVECLRRADVFAFPSLREAGGAVVLEAMSLGLPVIAADWGGPSDFLSVEEGILVPTDSPASFERGFAEAMLRLAKDEQLRHRMGKAARAKVLAGYTWDQRVRSLLELYRTLLATISATNTSNGMDTVSVINTVADSGSTLEG